MAKTRKITAAYFSKWRAFYWLFFLCVTAIFAIIFSYDAYNSQIRFGRDSLAMLMLLYGLFLGSQWNTHLFRVIRTKDPHIRIEGDDIIAFGKVFPKGPNNYMLFEKRGGNKLGYWITLRNNDEVMVIPLIPKQYFEEYVEPVGPDKKMGPL